MRRLGPTLAPLGLLVCVSVAGCGLGPGTAPPGVRLTVSEDFGATVLRRIQAPRIAGQETVMRLLQRNLSVQTRYGGGFVESIAGHAGGQRSGRPVDWFFYVNGSESPLGAASVRVHPGDRIWWDRHNWRAATQTPAVVGSFPEPFVHGAKGKRLPVRVECAAPGGRACGLVVDRLVALGVPAGQGSLDLSSGSQTLRVLVGPWSTLRGDPVAATLERGPRQSGVYVRPEPSGRALSILNEDGNAARTASASTGLVAATRQGDHQPVWIVSGTDEAGTLAAAARLDSVSLANRFAIAVEHGALVGLPTAVG